MIRRIIKRDGGLIWLCIFIFLSGSPFGYIYYEDAEPVLSPTIENLKELIHQESRFETALSIFANNFRVSIFLVILGTLIIPALIIMFVNGFLVGFIARMLMNKDIGIDFFLKGVLPHGLIELAAIFISAAVGMRIGLSFLTTNGKDRAWRVSRGIKDAVKAELFIVLPLLLTAAFIEAYVSAALVGA